ncbi:MAG: hypothetical protein RR738_02050 [Anaerorhabdus sp.]
MREKELDLKLKLFKYQVKSLIIYEEKLILINEELSGNIHSVSYRGEEESKYQRSKKVYKNNLIEVLDEETYYIEKRDTSLYAVREIMKYLQCLNNEEVDLLERIYWYDHSYDRIAEVYNYDKSTISRKKETILSKMQRVASKKLV